MMKGVEKDALTTTWVNARAAHLLSVCRMTAIEVGDGIVEESSLDDCDQVMFTQNVETIEAFSSHVVLVKVGRAYTGGHINIMVKPYRPKTTLCHRASQYKTCTQSWGKEVKRQLWW